MKTITTTLLIIAALMDLAGCSSSKPTAQKLPAPQQSMDTAAQQLAAAANSVSNSLNTLAEVQQAATPPKRVVQPINPSSYGMGQLVTIDWTGPVEPLLDRIATLTNYKIRKLGVKPATPIVVSIAAHDTPIGDVLRNAGFQCGNKANIVIFPGTHVIELRYAQA